MGSTKFRPPATVTIVAGKGGVGKTTVSATLAFAAARAGLTTLIVDVERKSGLPALLGADEPLGYQESVLLEAGQTGPGSAELRARTLTPDDALVEYLEDHGMRRVSRRLTSTGTLDVVATAVPGIKDILVLGKVKQLEASKRAGRPDAPDFIVVDAPAAGHAVTFLASAYGLLDAAAVGPIRAQATEVIGLLSDPARCQVMLVTIPEETPVNEAADTAFHLEDRAGVQLAPIVVNGLWPHLDLPAEPSAQLDQADADRVASSADFRRQRQRLQDEQVKRLGEMLPLPQIRLPFLFSTELGPKDVEVLADSLGPQLAGLEDGD
ncbi:MAG TPA: ArsA-related P-loop ATPase [Acidimicrobiales bacterium]|nr:ArsA-related P-loop ATPase [Acidimicrobiales bacterium]